ncbi:MAG TPA: tRNA lysidine(34) synthetase TilS, partial [Bacteroidales bacterium]|nr:tRNA lysidine(34) synthetase TilS [Bacteroidales bacterium]
NFPYVATAHHRDDQVETFMINLIRGADFKSLSGIKPVSGKIIHPLLFATKQNIIEYATKKQLTHREDISNQSDKYLRNKIRHNLLPLMEQIYPGAINSIILATQKISDTYEIINSNVEKESKQCISKYNGFTEIDIDKLLKLKPLRLYLHEFIKPYGFNYETTIKIIAAIKKNPGKLFFSTSHQLLIDRNKIIIYTKNNITNNIDEKILINANTSICNHPVKLHFSIIPKTNNFKIPSSNNIACLDYDKLKFPLIIRKWKHGDKFKPLGMIFFKKISDFLIDKKVPLILKKNIYVMCSNENIVWVVGMRIDNRYKLTDTTKNVFFCEIIN